MSTEKPSSRVRFLTVAVDIVELQISASAAAVGSHTRPSSSKAQSSFQALSNSPDEKGAFSSINSLVVVSGELEAEMDPNPAYCGIDCFKNAMQDDDVGTSSKVTGHCAIADTDIEG